MHATPLVVTFKTPKPPRTCRVDDLLLEEVERFAAADPRWRNVLEMAAARLDPPARATLGVALSGLPAGPAPALLSYDFDPDDEDAYARELARMDPRLQSGLGLLSAERLSLDPRTVGAIRGIVSAVHRLLRVAKTRP